ncbi:universal stress protein [Yersinia enterocolitica]|uniref:Universal stress protein n=2 Tax=Yersinia TaxID=629 RepID=A0AAD2V1V1_YEREN|nr:MULTISPECIES: universal stress protein [Yersinia]EKN6067043.1 universal stress protein [Yersinia enterocolitica]ELI8102979.1 universal stress protein [Yersinia enterocolitica]ELI8126934.1 universal stress protein [Yersinia enterocolitica]ELW8946956.1 universal stress protein [Yersinia enterocolitica]CNK90084.1 Universal stress protein family [Yersinia aleksiciae]
MKDTIIGCIDGSSSATAVCQYGAWVASKLNVPLTLLHVLEKADVSTSKDLSGSIGFDSREVLLAELVQIEGERARLMKEQGKQLLRVAGEMARSLGVNEVNAVQKHGALAEILGEIPDAKMMVLGRKGEQSETREHVGSQLESVIRLQKCPILVSTGDFVPPRRIMFAYDGSAEGKKVLERLAINPLLQGIDCHLVMNGDDLTALEAAQITLKNVGINSQVHLISGSHIAESLCRYALENDIHLMIMGAYGHSRLRQFFIGSNTTAMLAKTPIPLLMMR